ncbi:MAG: purine/pyrimidine permease [Synergistaceae bacterium]|jgi:NCS2 family nucleobase:cation symporter-2|nr:purine/pyrimidine permease [Synergistaceae bacterium]
MEENKTSGAKKDLIYQLDGIPPIPVAVPLGLQHILAMFTSNLAPCLILAGIVGLDGPDRIIMVQCAMFVSGITTFFQLYPIPLFGKKSGLPRIGAELPIVMGTSFAFVPTSITVAKMYGLPGVLGGALVGSLVEIAMSFFIKPLKKYFPPLVIGAVSIAFGVSLLKAGTNYFLGGVGKPDFGSVENISLGLSVFATVVICQRFGKGIFKVSAILMGIIVGYVVAFFMGKLNFALLSSANWFSVPIPFRFSYEFHLDAILMFSALYIVSGLETIGNTSGITVAVFDRDATTKEMSGAVLADSLGSMIATVFNTLPNTAFGQNAGLVAMTKVINKFCIATGATVLVVAGFIPKIGAIFSLMPDSVLGGAVLSVFAMITVNGIKLVTKSGFSQRNVTTLSTILAIGMGLAGMPEGTYKEMPVAIQYLFKDSVAATCIIGIIINAIFPADKVEEAVIEV